MSRDLLQIFWTAIVQRNTNVCLFKRFNIVCTVTGHERDVPLRLEGHKGELLLRRRGAGELSSIGWKGDDGDVQCLFHIPPIEI